MFPPLVNFEQKKMISHRGRGDEEHAEDAEKSFGFADDFLSPIFVLFASRTLREKRRRIHAEGAKMKNTQSAQKEINETNEFFSGDFALFLLCFQREKKVPEGLENSCSRDL